MPPSTLIQSVVYKPSKRKDVFYEMSSTCPVCKLKCSRKDVMLRHKRNKHGTTHPYPQSSDAYPPLREGYTPPLREIYAAAAAERGIYATTAAAAAERGIYATTAAAAAERGKYATASATAAERGKYATASAAAAAILTE